MSDRRYSHRELMEMAIDISGLSVPEHKDKTDPLVGAIITTSDGEILDTAHRGELRVGEHCEFTLIERKLKGTNLKGCILYVTLEPCTDISRKLPKRGCSTHIVKSRISDVYIGVLDPNPNIAGTGQSYLESKGVNVHRIPSDLENKILSMNEVFFREKEEEAMIAASAPAPISKHKVSEEYAVGRSIDKMSEDLIDEFLEVAGATFRFKDDKFYGWASEFGIVMKYENKYLVTDLGLRLFGKEPETLLQNNIFKTEIKHGNGETDIRDFEGSLIKQYVSIKDYIRLLMKKKIDKSSGVRKESYEFPVEAIDEAVANALLHRDYSIPGMTNYLYMDDNKIIIRSPGTVFRPLSVTDLNDFQAPSNCRNPKMMFVFNKLGFSEQRGIGLRKMGGLPMQNFDRPIFKEGSGWLEVVFDRTPMVNEPKYLEVLGVMDRLGMAISKSELSEELGLTARTAERYLSEMVKKNIIKTTGSGRNTKYSRYRS